MKMKLKQREKPAAKVEEKKKEEVAPAEIVLGDRLPFLSRQ